MEALLNIIRKDPESLAIRDPKREGIVYLPVQQEEGFILGMLSFSEAGLEKYMHLKGLNRKVDIKKSAVYSIVALSQPS
jgi:hypothetical protein